MTASCHGGTICLAGEKRMGFERQDSFARREECKAAWESEVEFAEMARVLKALAA